MAEPMDLSDGGIAAMLERAIVAAQVRDPDTGRYYIHPDYMKGLRSEVYRVARAIRDAATAAERERCIAILEKDLREHYLAGGHNALAALRGGDHEDDAG